MMAGLQRWRANKRLDACKTVEVKVSCRPSLVERKQNHLTIRVWSRWKQQTKHTQDPPLHHLVGQGYWRPEGIHILRHSCKGRIWQHTITANAQFLISKIDYHYWRRNSPCGLGFWSTQKLVFPWSFTFLSHRSSYSLHLWTLFLWQSLPSSKFQFPWPSVLVQSLLSYLAPFLTAYLSPALQVSPSSISPSVYLCVIIFSSPSDQSTSHNLSCPRQSSDVSWLFH